MTIDHLPRGTPKDAGPSDELVPALEELDLRLETSPLSVPDEEAWIPCFWACSCFLIHGD